MTIISRYLKLAVKSKKDGNFFYWNVIRNSQSDLKDGVMDKKEYCVSECFNEIYNKTRGDAWYPEAWGIDGFTLEGFSTVPLLKMYKGNPY